MNNMPVYLPREICMLAGRLRVGKGSPQHEQSRQTRNVDMKVMSGPLRG